MCVPHAQVLVCGGRLHSHSRVHVCGCQRVTVGVFLSFSPLYVLRQGVSLTLKLVDWLGCPASDFKDPPESLLAAPPPSVETASLHHHT